MNAEATRFVRIAKTYLWILLLGANLSVGAALVVVWARPESPVARQVCSILTAPSGPILFR